MGLEVGAIIEGRVTGIAKFGAFVALPGGRSGLIHISEVASHYVSDVSEYLSIGQTVRVRVLSIAPDGKINLSLKQAAPPRPEPPRAPRPVHAPRSEHAQRQEHREYERAHTPAAYRSAPAPDADSPGTDRAFEDRLKKFMQESDSRIADNKMYADNRRRRRK